MKAFLTTCLLSFALVTCIWPRASMAANTDDADTALMALENKWVDAIVKRDTALLENILADSYVDTDETGQRSNKQGVLSYVRSSDVAMRSITLSGMHVYLYGDAAVVTGNAMQIGTYKGAPIARNVLFTDTFTKLRGRWQAVASGRSPRQ